MDTLNFVSGGIEHMSVIAAYVDNRPIDEAVAEAMADVAEDDELIILTDMTGGSVNQKFFSFRTRPHTHVVSGMNLPVAFALAMEPGDGADGYFTNEHVHEIVEESRQELRYINEISADGDDEDE